MDVERKYEWPGWAHNGGYLDFCSHSCPVCQYFIAHGVGRKIYVLCNQGKDCLIRWTATRRFCETQPSPYAHWKKSYSIESERTKYALEICALIIDALDKLSHTQSGGRAQAAKSPITL